MTPEEKAEYDRYACKTCGRLIRKCTCGGLDYKPILREVKP